MQRNRRNKKKRYPLLAIALLLCSISILILFMQHPSQTAAGQYEEYVVEPGDTLWSIAGERNDGRDVREVIWEIQEINSITPIIHVGQALLVPEVER